MGSGLHGPPGVPVLKHVALEDNHEPESAPIHVRNMAEKVVWDAVVKQESADPAQDAR